MGRLIKKVFTATAVVGLMMGAYVVAEEPTNFDYTGLPVTEFPLEDDVTYITIPTALRLPECEVVEGQDDYTGVDATRCNPVDEPLLDWSYLY
jgi:hypothetical protein